MALMQDPQKKTGYVHSFQSLGAVDGPGIRYVIFLRGCPYRCPYCHNPDTRTFSSGVPYSPEELTRRILRYRTYFGTTGGVTVSGGEPLCQAEFLTELFCQLRKEGIHTAVDTAAVKPTKAIEELLHHTNMVLCDIKFPDDARYREEIGIPLSDVLSFLSLCERMHKEIIIRHVVVPGMTDTPESVRAICRLAKSVCTPQKIELLPFKKLCIEKYDALGIPFPLRDTPECPPETISLLRRVAEEEMSL